MENLNANILKSLDVIKDELQRGIIDAKEANIRFIEAKRYVIIKNRLPSDVRKALSEGVKQGRLIRVRKTDYNPEYYYKPNFEYLVKQELYRKKINIENAIMNICK